MILLSELFLIDLFCSLFLSWQDFSTPVLQYFIIFFSAALWLEISENKNLKIIAFIIFFISVFILTPNLAFFSPVFFIVNLPTEENLKPKVKKNILKNGIIMLKPLVLFVSLVNCNLIFFVFCLIVFFYSVQKEITAHTGKKLTALQDTLTENMIENEKQKKRLQNDILKNAEAAVLTERSRISRSLHNSVGHTLSSAILQVNALKYLTENKDAQNNLDILQNVLENGLSEIRTCLHDIHNDSFDLQTSVEKIISHTEKPAINFNCKIETLPYVLKHDIFSIIQECISNTIKHSGATKMEICLLEQHLFYSLSIEDNGGGADLKKSFANGIGLMVLKETVEKNKGTINFYSENGFRIHAVFPKAKM